MAKIKQIINGDDKLIRSGAIIEFSSGELVTLSNALYAYLKDDNVNEKTKQLKDIIYIASQISQYGHMEEWAVSVLSRSVEDYEESK
jgi:hypothetical protein